jgi:hypothetical protein
LCAFAGSPPVAYLSTGTTTSGRKARKGGSVLRYLLIGLLALGGCSSGEMAAAERGVAEFRAHMDAGQFAAVYADGSDELRKSASEPDLTKVLRALAGRLGKARDAEANGWKINFHTSGTFVTLSYKTSFEKGPATEQFVFRVADGKALLVSYHVNSNALLAN